MLQKKAQAAEARRMEVDQQHRVEVMVDGFAERLKREEEERRLRERETAMLRSGLHEGRFYALSGDEIDVTIQVEGGVRPTVKDWKVALAREHFLCPSFRWVVLWDDGEILEDAVALTFYDETAGEERILNALQKVVPELLDFQYRASDIEQLRAANRDTVLRMLESSPGLFEFVSEQFRADRELAEVAISGYSGCFCHVTGALREDRALAVAALKRNFGPWLVLGFLSEAMLEDEEILQLVLNLNLKKYAIAIPSFLLEYLPTHCRSNEAVVLKAIASGCSITSHDWNLIDHDLRGNEAFVLKALHVNGAVLQFCSASVKADREMVKIAIASSYRSVLGWASTDLQTDRSMVLLQVRKCPGYLRGRLGISEPLSSTPKWHDDAEIVRIAAQLDMMCCSLLGPDLIEDREFVVELLEKHGLRGWRHIVRSKHLLQDRELAIWATSLHWDPTRPNFCGSLFDFWTGTPSWWKSDEPIVRTSLARHGNDLQYLSERFRSNREIVRIAIRQNPDALQFATYSLRDDKELVLEAVRNMGTALEFASSRLRADRQVAEMAVRQSAAAFHYVDEQLRLEVDAIKTLARETARRESISERGTRNV